MSTTQTTATTQTPQATQLSAFDIRLATGGIHNLVTLSTTQITLEDVALALSRIPRFAGQTPPNRVVSVAEHSRRVARLAAQAGASAEVQLAALLHDAHEAIWGDDTTPKKALFKTLFTLSYRVNVYELMENLQQDCVVYKLSGLRINAGLRQRIKVWDLLALKMESRPLLNLSPNDVAAHSDWERLCNSYPEADPLELDKLGVSATHENESLRFFEHAQLLKRAIEYERTGQLDERSKIIVQRWRKLSVAKRKTPAEKLAAKQAWAELKRSGAWLGAHLPYVKALIAAQLGREYHLPAHMSGDLTFKDYATSEDWLKNHYEARMLQLLGLNEAPKEKPSVASKEPQA
jgi:uncharacterized protein